MATAAIDTSIGVKEREESYEKEKSDFTSSSCLRSRRVQDWFADSGTTQHITDQRSFFNTFTPITSGN